MGLVQTGKTSMSATFEWDEIEDAATWEYGVVVDTFAVTDFVPAEEDFTGSTEEYSATIDTLQENTKYIFFVRRDCGVTRPRKSCISSTLHTHSLTWLMRG